METFRLAAVGDIMLGDHPVCFGHGVRSTIRKRGFAHLIAGVKPDLARHDIFVGNLECVLSDIGHDEQKLSSSELRGDKNSAEALNLCEFNVLSMANNHMLQHTPEAFHDTSATLKRNNVLPVGLYENGLSNVVKIHKGNVKLALIAYSFRPEHFCKDNSYYAHPEPDAVLGQIAALKAELPDHSLVVSLHWGEEYLHTPAREQIELAHRMIDRGATLILGHHPHVLQGIEKYRDGLIAYSLGNFIFDSWQLPTRESAILSCTFSEQGLVDFEVTPVFIKNDFSLSVAEGSRRDISRKITDYTKDIVNLTGIAALEQTEYDRIAASAYLKYRLQCYTYFVVNAWKYKPNILFSSLFRSILRRAGIV
jgi:gamma-polyglutamate biosynthesis protein CapA